MKAEQPWATKVLERHPEIFSASKKESPLLSYAAPLSDRQCSSDRHKHGERPRNNRTSWIDPEPDATSSRVRKGCAGREHLDGPVDRPLDRSLFLFRRAERFAADFSNLYALLPADVWRRIAAQVGELRVLYTMRHPVHRLWSHVKFHLAVTGRSGDLDDWGPEQFRDFAFRPFIWDNAEYGRALRRMREGLPGGTLKPVFYEEIHADRAAFLSDLEGFLGLASHCYPAELVDRRVNTTANRTMPDFFPGLFRDDFRRICTEVEAEGLDLPASWSDIRSE